MVGITSYHFFNTAHTYTNLGPRYYEDAIKALTEAIRLNPEDPDLYNIRGLSYAALGQHDQAIQDYDEAIRLDPKDADFYSNRGLAYAALGKSTEAESDYAKARDLRAK